MTIEDKFHIEYKYEFVIVKYYEKSFWCSYDTGDPIRSQICRYV